MRFNIIFALILFSSISLFSHSQTKYNAPVMKITRLEPRSNATDIHLSNGTIWTYKDLDLLNGWHVGDKVEIAYGYWDDYYLQNMSRPGDIPVKFCEVLNGAPVATIKKIKKQNDTHTIVVDDNTKWHVGLWSSAWMKEWKAGDRLIVTGHDFLVGRATHLIVNLDRRMGSLRSNVRARILHTLPKSRKKPEVITYNLSITKVSKKKNHLLIELNNKMALQCKKPKEKWKRGDKVTLSCTEKGVQISNRKNDEDLLGHLSKNPDKNYLIKKISGKKIALDDGSTWILKQVMPWKVDDRIVVSSMDVGLDMSTHELFNLNALENKSNEESSSSATLIFK